MNFDTIKAGLASIEDKFLKYWFLISSLIIAILYYLYERRGIALSKAIYDAQEALLAQKLQMLDIQGVNSQEDYEKAKKEYDTLKRRHSDIFDRLQLSPPTK